MLGLVSRHLKGMGFTVVAASEGDAAWELAQKHRPDLVVLDVMMPGMSGWEVCKRVKGPSKDQAFSGTGVIMLTGIGENLNDMTSPLFAADTWLNKPFDFRDLESRIHETLAKYGKSLAEGSHAASTKKAPAKKPSAKKAPAKKTVTKKSAKTSAAKKSVTKKSAKKTARSK